MLFCIDSDGCVFDNMQWKHDNAFLPAFLEVFKLDEFEKEIGEFWRNINLFSKTRGINRFAAFLLCLKRIKIVLKLHLPEYTELEIFLADPENRNISKLEKQFQNRPFPLIEEAIAWSNRVSEILNESEYQCPPFDAAVESLKFIKESGHSIAVVSQAPHQTLIQEWEESDISRFTDWICGQEYGSKQVQVEGLIEKSSSSALLVGDAPGDLEAAQKIPCPFYPIIPGSENDSWMNLLNHMHAHGAPKDKFLSLALSEFEEKLGK